MKKVNPEDVVATPYLDSLYADLRESDEEARLYLQLTMEDDDPRVFLTALKDVINARGLKMTDLARQTGLNREHLYRVFSKRGNPNWQTITKILDTLGFTFSIGTKAKAS